MAGIAGAAFDIGGQLLSAPSKRKGVSNLKQARKIERKNRFLSALQKRRAFIAQSRAALADSISAGISSGASLESSRTQASAASLTTQSRTILDDQQEAFTNSQRISSLTEAATVQFQQATDIQGAANMIGTLGDAVTQGQ